MTPIKTKEIGNYRIEIFQDEYCESPRNSIDNLGTMICFHNRYNLGDSHHYNENDYSNWDELKKAIIKNEDVLHILPLYLYDHSGITIDITPFSCRWDSGQVGFIYVTKNKVREYYNVKRITKRFSEQVLEILKNEVKTYDRYLTGDVYGYKIYLLKKCELDHTHKEEIDSSWGYYGKDACMREAEFSLKYYNKTL